jgi:hypothetical protein
MGGKYTQNYSKYLFITIASKCLIDAGARRLKKKEIRLWEINSCDFKRSC